MGKSVSIDVEVDIEIDEYMEYASDEALIYEVNDRDLDFTKDLDLDLEQKINILTSGMSITQAYMIQEAVKKILE